MSTCNKICYYSPAVAYIRLQAVVRRTREGKRAPVDIYPCKQCSAWHLTSHGKPRWIVKLDLRR